MADATPQPPTPADAALPCGLYLIPTPIGNMEDITLRALRVLGAVDALACEDTRHTRLIFARHGIRTPRTIFPCHEHNEDGAARRVAGLLREGLSVGLCSNAGFPGISDPGYRVVEHCVTEGFRIEALPGPSAVPAALAASGLPSGSFLFKGFPPRKPGPLRRFLAEEADRPHTLICFESPYRLPAFLAAALEALGDRKAAVCLELSKRFERIERGFLSDLAARFPSSPKGEVTIVIAGNHPKLRRAEPPAADGEEGDRTIG